MEEGCAAGLGGAGRNTCCRQAAAGVSGMAGMGGAQASGKEPEPLSEFYQFVPVCGRLFVNCLPFPLHGLDRQSPGTCHHACRLPFFPPGRQGTVLVACRRTRETFSYHAPAHAACSTPTPTFLQHFICLQNALPLYSPLFAHFAVGWACVWWAPCLGGSYSEHGFLVFDICTVTL